MSRSDSLRLVGPLERALFLKSLGPLADLSPSEIAVFAENARERTFEKGSALLRAGERVGAWHVVVEGSVRATGGESLAGETIGPRESVGFLTMLAREDEGLEAVAEEDSVTLEFEEEVFHDILEDNFGIVAFLMQRLAKAALDVRQQVPTGTYLAPLEGLLKVPENRPLDLVERIVMFRRPGSPFGDASLEAVARLAQVTPEVHFEAGHTLWKSGDRSDHALILIKGTVACTTQWGISRFRAGPGYPLGNLERLSGDPRWFTAYTETPVVAIHSDTESLLDMLEDHFDMVIPFVQSMAKRVIDIRRESAAPVPVS